MEEQEKAIGMKSIRAISGLLTYIDTASGETIPENAYEVKYKDYTAKIRHLNMADVRNHFIKAQFDASQKNEVPKERVSHTQIVLTHSLISIFP